MKIELILIPFGVLVLVGKYLENQTLMAIGGVPILLYIGLHSLDIIMAIGASTTTVQGRITNVGEHRSKLTWKDFDLLLRDGTTMKFSVLEPSFPSDIYENDWIEVTYKKTGILAITEVTKISRLAA